jgi:hypothetical protein
LRLQRTRLRSPARGTWDDFEPEAGPMIKEQALLHFCQFVPVIIIIIAHKAYTHMRGLAFKQGEERVENIETRNIETKEQDKL